MKIIAIIRENYGRKYMMEVDAEEVNAIAGQDTGRLAVGSEIHVCQVVRRTKDILEVQRTLDAHANGLRAVASLLDTIQVVIPPVVQLQPEEPSEP